MYLSQVFVGCNHHGGGYGIYAAHVQQNEIRLNFTKIVSPTANVFGITHHEDLKQLFYTVSGNGIYKCDFDGANNEQVFRTGKFKGTVFEPRVLQLNLDSYIDSHITDTPTRDGTFPDFFLCGSRFMLSKFNC